MCIRDRVYTARLVKKEHPNSKVVFIGPCAAKKLEAMQEDIRTDVDFVLTYEELMGIFEAKEINFSALSDSPDLDEGTRAGRGFAVAGGVAAAVEELIHKEHPDIELKTQRADGLRDCRKLLMLAKAGKLDGYLLEGMACPGGCVAGAGTVVSADTAAKKLAQDVYKRQVRPPVALLVRGVRRDQRAGAYGLPLPLRPDL